MWLTYNRRLLKFFKDNTSTCILVSQEALVSGLDLVSEVNSNFDLKLNASIPSPVKGSYYDEQVNKNVYANLTTDLRNELNFLYAELASYGSGEVTKITPETINKPILSTSEKLVQDRVLSLQSLADSQGLNVDLHQTEEPIPDSKNLEYKQIPETYSVHWVK